MKHKVVRSFIALMLVIGLVAVQAPTSVHAATLTVTNNNDSGPGSLRQAILDASSGDTIDFDADYTITLSSQLPVIDKEITINGNGAANTVIEASTCNPVTLPGGCTPATYPVFEVNPNGNLTIDSLTVRHGNCDDPWQVTCSGGGGINTTIDFINGGGSLLTITNSIFANNKGGSAGGIYCNDCILNVTNSTFSENSARAGGAIGILSQYHRSSNIANSTFSNNSSMGHGGGIYIGNGIITIQNTTFSGNHADQEGGGIFNWGGTLTIMETTFLGNSADFYGGEEYNDGGGGIMNSGGTVTVAYSTFSENSAANKGGGIFNSNALAVTNSTFSSNNAGIWGGGIATNSVGTATVTNSTFTNNSAEAGGGIFSAMLGTPLIVENSTFSENSGTFIGGGIFNGAFLDVISSTFSANDGGLYGGGGIGNYYGTLHLMNTILANSTTGEDCYNWSGDIIATNVNNLIETNGPSGHMCGTPALSADPMLGPLADNGGPTQTMALLAGSPAIDAGDNATCKATDQRGITRPQGAACDIGAFEVEVILIEVDIDIKPGSDTNPINPNSKGMIPVAILSTPDFDAPSVVDVTSLTFGRTGKEASLAFCNDNGEDVNGDGLLDLVCHFDNQLTILAHSKYRYGNLKGSTLDGIKIEGRDNVTIIN